LIDAKEACALFAAYCEPGSSAAEVKRTASSLLSALDTNRNGKLSFDEFAFRQVICLFSFCFAEALCFRGLLHCKTAAARCSRKRCKEEQNVNLTHNKT
jgi:hypothetical protein